MTVAQKADTSAGRARWPGLRREVCRIRYRLLLVNVLIVSVPIVGIGFARVYEREMLRGLEDDMVHQAQVLRVALLADPAGLRLHERAPMLAASARHTRTRIRLLDASGQLVADSHANGPPEGRSEHAPDLLGDRVDPPVHAPVPLSAAQIAARSEVRQALAGHYGSTTRIWKYQGGSRAYLFSALPRVWDRFFTTRPNQGGTGLGLAIVASVVKHHHGSVAVASDAVVGTTFSFDLPE